MKRWEGDACFKGLQDDVSLAYEHCAAGLHGLRWQQTAELYLLPNQSGRKSTYIYPTGEQWSGSKRAAAVSLLPSFPLVKTKTQLHFLLLVLFF